MHIDEIDAGIYVLDCLLLFARKASFLDDAFSTIDCGAFAPATIMLSIENEQDVLFIA
jgi:hypothetical protein